MGLPVFFPAADIARTLPPGRALTVRTLCELAGVVCGVTGAPAERPVRLARAAALRALTKPGPLSEVWLGVPRGSPQRRALLALALLAYGAFDYCARESLRGLPIAQATHGRGRPASGVAMSAAQRQRRHRARLARRARAS